MKKKEYDKLESVGEAKRKLRAPNIFKVKDLSNPSRGIIKPKDPIELQIWKLETKLGILQKEFREHNHDEGKI